MSSDKIYPRDSCSPTVTLTITVLQVAVSGGSHTIGKSGCLRYDTSVTDSDKAIAGVVVTTVLAALLVLAIAIFTAVRVCRSTSGGKTPRSKTRDSTQNVSTSERDLNHSRHINTAKSDRQSGYSRNINDITARDVRNSVPAELFHQSMGDISYLHLND